MTTRSLILADWEVRGFLAGTKSQIRRPVKFGPQFPDPASWSYAYPCDDGGWTWTDAPVSGDLLRRMQARPGKLSPFGSPADLIVCRETWANDFEHNLTFYRADEDADGTVPYLSQGAGGFGGGVGNARIDRWRSPAIMPRWASRLALEVIEVLAPRRVRDISEKEAKTEGIAEPVPVHGRWCDPAKGRLGHWSYRKSFAELWDARYIKRGFPWETAWCWAGVAKRIKP